MRKLREFMVSRGKRDKMANAIRAGDLETVKDMIEKQRFPINTGLNELWQTPLHVAARWSQTDIIDYLDDKNCNHIVGDR